MKFWISFSITIVLATFLFAQTIFADELSVKSIQEELKTNADAILRERLTIIEIKDMRTATVREKYVVTILNAQGKSFGHFYGAYFQHQTYGNIKAEVYDQNNVLIRRIRSSDISDMSLVSGASLFEDSRVKKFEVHQPTYPYTVAVEYELTYKGFVSFPRWMPQRAGNLSIVEANLVVIYPENNPVRYKAINIDQPVEYRHSKDLMQVSWSAKNIPAYKHEPLSPPVHEYLPVVYLAPDNFYFHDTQGNLRTWESYGNWVASLLDGRQTLNISVIQQVNEIIKGADNNPREITKRIYEFMQSHTRYVSIQLGIGGFQPFPASEVASTGYGDCKALSNYTKALLDAAGIESYYTEIGVDNQSIVFDDFPSLDQTNHVILCVPLETDTVWLECTSQRSPFGYVVNSVQNRKALIVKEGGSKLVNIPSYGSKKNKKVVEIGLALDNNGNADIAMKSKFYGSRIETLFPEVWQSRQEQLEAITLKYANLKGTIDNFEMTLSRDDEITAFENLNMRVGNYASKTGSRLFVNAYPLGGSGSTLQRIKDRKTDFVLEKPYSDNQTVTITLPENYRIENLPGTIRHDTSYGNYLLTFEATENEVLVIREFVRNNGRFPAAEYNDYVTFMQSVSKADRSQIVLIEK